MKRALQALPGQLLGRGGRRDPGDWEAVPVRVI
jgi:hypothetical protein